jgi:hypothetical protein
MDVWLMSRLQARRQSHRRRREAINNLRKVGMAVSAIVLLWFIWQLPSTKAYFIDQEETQSFFRAATFDDNLLIFPGKTKTNDSPGDPGPAFLVAQNVSGQIYLNFGTYPPGNNRNFPHVLTVRNIGDRTLSLRWRFTEALTQHFETQDEDIILGPGAEIELGFKLDTSPQDQPAEIFGALHLSALNGFITTELPARLRLADVGSGNDDSSNGNGNGNNDDSCDDNSNSSYSDSQNTSGADEPPGVGVTESVYQSPDYSGKGPGKNNHKGGQSGGQDNNDNGDTSSEEGSDN